MLAWFAYAAWAVAAVSTGAFLALWCWEVKRLLRQLKSTVDSAASQLESSRRRAAEDRADVGAAEVLARSESIWRQAVAHYDATLKKPWFGIPGYILGFRPIMDRLSEQEPGS